MSHFFAYLSRMKFIKRWGLMHNTYPENIQEHSLRVAMIAHVLALVRNRKFGGRLSPERAAVLALYHDSSEVLTGDMPAPIKYFNPDIEKAYHSIEDAAGRKLLDMMPEELRSDFADILTGTPDDDPHRALVRAADKLCAYIKCLEEVSAGNPEFIHAEKTLKKNVENIDLPEVKYFLKVFTPSFALTLDELG